MESQTETEPAVAEPETDTPERVGFDTRLLAMFLCAGRSSPGAP